jgi:NTP pyrophosphatase (non-canonical NTP hydrolase)
MYIPSFDYGEFVTEQSLPKYLLDIDCPATGFSLMLSRAVLGIAAESEEYFNIVSESPKEEYESELGDVLFWYSSIYYILEVTVRHGEAAGAAFTSPKEVTEHTLYQSLLGATEKLTRKADTASITKHAKSILYYAWMLLSEVYDQYTEEFNDALPLSEIESKNRAKLEARVQKQGSPT